MRIYSTTGNFHTDITFFFSTIIHFRYFPLLMTAFLYRLEFTIDRWKYFKFKMQILINQCDRPWFMEQVYQQDQWFHQDKPKSTCMDYSMIIVIRSFVFVSILNFWTNQSIGGNEMKLFEIQPSDRYGNSTNQQKQTQ